METRANYVIVGSFVVGLTIAALVFVLWISRVDFGNGASLYDIFFEGSVSGLRVNEDVRYHGIPIGKVKDIAVDPKNIDRVRVRVAITETGLMREDVIASIEIQGLTGYAYIQIQGGGSSSPLLKAKEDHPYPIIPSQPSKIDLLFTNVPHILSSVYELSEQLNELFDKENRDEVRHLMKNLSKISGQLAEGRNSLENLVQESRNTLRQVNQSVASFSEDMRTSLNVFSRTVEEIRLTIRDNQGDVEKTLNDLPKTLGQVRRAADELRKLTRELERNPLGLLSKPEKEGYRTP